MKSQWQSKAGKESFKAGSKIVEPPFLEAIANAIQPDWWWLFFIYPFVYATSTGGFSETGDLAQVAKAENTYEHC